MTRWEELDRFLATDPLDVGCEQTMLILHIYVDLLIADPTAAEAKRRYGGIAAHLRSCGACTDDLEGLLLAARSAT